MIIFAQLYIRGIAVPEPLHGSRGEPERAIAILLIRIGIHAGIGDWIKEHLGRQLGSSALFSQ
ncbi:hypothetical protein KDK_52260 [Dictyobacter kobayashii]|uniref:Uncharacterized protein n=1 Tax=Dictyobacter kobayashii TaxID=2014872 RepID=A0A402AQQ8_9CHLR|nr:hypothetical protein KDK_52260 [Dictyobacter kobayashii]